MTHFLDSYVKSYAPDEASFDKPLSYHPPSRKPKKEMTRHRQKKNVRVIPRASDPPLAVAMMVAMTMVHLNVSPPAMTSTSVHHWKLYVKLGRTTWILARADTDQKLEGRMHATDRQIDSGQPTVHVPLESPPTSEAPRKVCPSATIR